MIGQTFRCEWPIVGDDLTLREIVAEAAPALTALINQAEVELLAPPRFTITIAPDGPPTLVAEAPACLRRNRRGRAPCGTDGGYYRHTRTIREEACVACRMAHAAAEVARSARARERDEAAA